MYEIRCATPNDVETLITMEIEIARISFGEDAITDRAFHAKKLLAAIEKHPLANFVIARGDAVLGWLWMDEKKDFVTNDRYVNLRSFYASEELRGQSIVTELLNRGLAYAQEIGAKRIVGKVHAGNLPMRITFKNAGFRPTHLTVEKELR